MLLPDIHTWAEWGQIFTDVAQWTPVVQEICRRQSMPFDNIKAGYPGTNAVFVLDRRFVVKVYCPFCHEDYHQERELYPLLEQYAGILAPRLLAHGTLQDRIEWPYIVMEFMPGRPIREVRAEISSANRAEIAADLGRLVRELHRIPLEQVHEPDPSREGWARFVRARAQACIVEHRQRGTLPPTVIDEMVPLLEAAQSGLETAPLVLVNGDLTEDHLLVGRRDGRWHISGLIDFADALVGQPEYEWIALWFGALDREAGCMRAFLHNYDPGIRIDEPFLQTAMAFTLLHEFGTNIVADVLQRIGSPAIHSLRELQDILWEDLDKEV